MHSKPLLANPNPTINSIRPIGKNLLTSIKGEKQTSLVVGTILFFLAATVRFWGIGYPAEVV